MYVASFIGRAGYQTPLDGPIPAAWRCSLSQKSSRARAIQSPLSYVTLDREASGALRALGWGNDLARGTGVCEKNVHLQNM